jgi:hypothetical protein
VDIVAERERRAKPEASQGRRLGEDVQLRCECEEILKVQTLMCSPQLSEKITQMKTSLIAIAEVDSTIAATFG